MKDAQAEQVVEVAGWTGRSVTDKDNVRDRLVHLMDRYEVPLYRFLFVLVADRDVASECAQDTFVRAYQNLLKGKPVNAGWLYKVARNRAMDEFRRKRHEAFDLETIENMVPDTALSGENNAAMQEAFAHLSPDDRSVLYLSAVQGLSAPELASALGIKPSAVRMRLCRARERFRLAYGAGA